MPDCKATHISTAAFIQFWKPEQDITITLLYFFVAMITNVLTDLVYLFMFVISLTLGAKKISVQKIWPDIDCCDHLKIYYGFATISICHHEKH